MGGTTAGGEPVRTPVAQPVARLEYICCRDGRVTKGVGSVIGQIAQLVLKSANGICQA